MFYAMYNNQVITASISKEKILNICDYINSNGLEAYNHVKNGARVVKNGFTKEGKQQYGIKYQKKIIQISIYKEKLQKICDEINDENLNKDGF